jgi:hypothetical protein
MYRLGSRDRMGTIMDDADGKTRGLNPGHALGRPA